MAAARDTYGITRQWRHETADRFWDGGSYHTQSKLNTDQGTFVASRSPAKTLICSGYVVTHPGKGGMPDDTG